MDIIDGIGVGYKGKSGTWWHFAGIEGMRTIYSLGHGDGNPMGRDRHGHGNLSSEDIRFPSKGDCLYTMIVAWPQVDDVPLWSRACSAMYCSQKQG